MKIYLLVFFLFSPLVAPFAAGPDKVLVMGYKDDAKLPFIGDSPDNSGAYVELFTKAAKAIGYDLKVVRGPKKRILADIQAGKIDFWPAADFDLDRAQYMYFFETGFRMSDVALTLAKVPPITDIRKFKGTLIAQLGDARVSFTGPNLKVQTFPNLSMDNADDYLLKGRGDVYVEDSPVIEYFLKTHHLKDFSSLGLKAHYGAFGPDRPMYVGFSMASPQFQGKPNPAYNSAKDKSIANFPVVLSADSVAGQFSRALQKLIASGEAQAIYDKYLR